jgi:arylsulfatase A-like enzyme
LRTEAPADAPPAAWHGRGGSLASLDLLKRLGLEEDTLVLFTSDNGHHEEGGYPAGLFEEAGPLRGKKRDLYEGGIRVPAIARWPGRVPAGAVSDHAAYFEDFLATAAELAGAPAPEGTDGLSFVPVLLGRAAGEVRHRSLYWELGADSLKYTSELIGDIWKYYHHKFHQNHRL